MNREWPILPYWAIPVYMRDYSDLDHGQGLDSHSRSSQLEDPRRGRFGRCWTTSEAGAVRMGKKPNGSLVVRASLPGVLKDDVKLDLRDEDGESILSLKIDKLEDHQSTDHYGGIFSRQSHFVIKRTIPLGQVVSVGDINAYLDDESLLIEIRLPSGSPNSSSRLDVHDDTKKSTQVPQTKSFVKEGKQEATGPRDTGFRI